MDIGQFVTAIVSLLIGVGILVYAGVSIARGKRKQEWAQTIGEIVTSEVKEIISHGDGPSPTYDPNVLYRYRANLVDYESNIISASEAPFSIGNEKYAKALVEKHRVGSKVPVYYNPDNPQEAVLEKRTSISGMVLLIGLGLFVLFCGGLLLIGSLAQTGLFD